MMPRQYDTIGCGDRASPACARRLSDNFLDDQKVMGKAFVVDERQFVLNSFANV